MGLLFSLLFPFVTTILLPLGFVLGFRGLGMNCCWLVTSCLVFYHLKIELTILKVDLGYSNRQQVTQTKPVALSKTADHLAASFKSVLILGQCGDGNESIDRQFHTAGMNTICKDTADDSFHGFTEVLVQEVQKLQFNEFPFGGCRITFHVAAVMSQFYQ